MPNVPRTLLADAVLELREWADLHEECVESFEVNRASEIRRIADALEARANKFSGARPKKTAPVFGAA